ncbi:MAG TPA: Trp family transcriptional regulator [Candidatus Limnocylindria bacterium]|nr:Trp family transcriptional regulator [Candidatus Limnocylindria bacterium]
MKEIISVWKVDSAAQLAQVLSHISDLPDMQAFLRDVMTEKEIIEISSRLEAARLLNEGTKYMDVIRQTKLSSRTVARISEWMQGGTGGYAKALQLLKPHTAHTPPVRAE